MIIKQQFTILLQCIHFVCRMPGWVLDGSNISLLFGLLVVSLGGWFEGNVEYSEVLTHAG